MTRVPFEKYEGLGNDFVVVETAANSGFDAAIVARLCDRHFGIGADGVLEVSPARSESADATMIVRNADGTRPEMCGNGLRCVAAYLARKGSPGPARFVVDTDAGPRICDVDGSQITVDMGIAKLDEPIVVRSLDTDFRFSRVSLGNPHAVSFLPISEADFALQGPLLSRHTAFPQGANVEFCRLLADGSIEVRVWERGVGPTLACGSGACAVAVHACTEGLASFEEPVTLRLPGGALVVTVSHGLGVRMRGPARRVFSGEVDA